MKALVTVKRVIDPYVKIRVKTDKTGVETQNVKMSMNPFDEIALEEAIRWQEKNIISEVVAVSIGNESCKEVLRQALALGAHKAILIQTDRQLCSLNIAKVLQKIVLQEQANVVFMGKQSIDGDNNQTPQMLAGLLHWAQATYASKIDLQEQGVEVTREVDGGLETLRLQLPAVISTDLRLNQPRYASLPNIMKARSKPLECLELDSLQLQLNAHQEIIAVNTPPTRKAGMLIESVEALMTKLQEAEVL